MDFSERDIYNEYGGVEGDVPIVHQAAAKGDITLLTETIWQDPSILELQNEEGLSPLANATQCQQLGAIKQLVKMGANINAQDKLGRTSLSIAAYQGWHEGVVYLQRHGAKHNISDKAGRTPLHASTYDKSTSTMSVLLLTLNLEEINKPDTELMTPLHWAAFHNRPEHLDLLYQKGADLFCQDVDGKTPLHWAAQNGCAECCTKLASYPDGLLLINSVDLSGKTPIHFAAAAGHVDVIKALHVFPGCDLEPEDPDERTPLHWAAAMGMINCINLLLSLGVKPNPVDAEGGTPLDYSIQSDHIDCQRLLEQKIGQEEKVQLKETDDHRTPDESQSSKNKRGPLSFIKDLFITRKHNCEIELRDNRNVHAGRHEQEDVTNKWKRRGSKNKRNSEINQEHLTYSKSALKPIEKKLPALRVSSDPDEKRCSSLNNTPDCKRHQIQQKHKKLVKRMSDGNISINKTDDALVTKCTSHQHEVDLFLTPTDKQTEKSSPRSLALQPLPHIHTPRNEQPEPSAQALTELVLGEIEMRDTSSPTVKPRKDKLAPLKGVKPLQGRNLLPHERVAAILKEESGPRSPTPPAGETGFSFSELHPGGVFPDRRHSHQEDSPRAMVLSARMKNKRNCSSSCADHSIYVPSGSGSNSPHLRPHSRKSNVLNNISNTPNDDDEVNIEQANQKGLSLPERKQLDRKIHSILY